MANPDIFKSDDIAKLCPVFYRTINQYGSTSCRSSFSRVKTGEFDLNMACVDGKFFNPKTKSCRFKIIREHTCGWALVLDQFKGKLIIFALAKHTCCRKILQNVNKDTKLESSNKSSVFKVHVMLYITVTSP